MAACTPAARAWVTSPSTPGRSGHHPSRRGSVWLAWLVSSRLGMSTQVIRPAARGGAGVARRRSALLVPVDLGPARQGRARGARCVKAGQRMARLAGHCMAVLVPAGLGWVRRCLVRPGLARLARHVSAGPSTARHGGAWRVLSVLGRSRLAGHGIACPVRARRVRSSHRVAWRARRGRSRRCIVRRLRAGRGAAGMARQVITWRGGARHGWHAPARLVVARQGLARHGSRQPRAPTRAIRSRAGAGNQIGA